MGFAALVDQSLRGRDGNVRGKKERHDDGGYDEGGFLGGVGETGESPVLANTMGSSSR